MKKLLIVIGLFFVLPSIAQAAPLASVKACPSPPIVQRELKAALSTLHATLARKFHKSVPLALARAQLGGIPENELSLLRLQETAGDCIYLIQNQVVYKFPR